MSEKKYIFKIDKSKYYEKLNDPSLDRLPMNFHGDIKLTCENCLLGKEIEIAEDCEYYTGDGAFLVLLSNDYLTIAEDKNVTDIKLINGEDEDHEYIKIKIVIPIFTNR